MPSGKAIFEKQLDAATSQMLLEPNWVTNLEICDSVRQNDITPKHALQSIRKRMKDTNPHVVKYALVVLETCVKNCGESFHEELASHEFMNEIRTLAQTGSAPVKEQVLAMLQAWNHAFRNNTKYQAILATYNLMKMEGHNFPPLNESDAMFSSDTAPAWKDGDVCHLCRVKFGTFTRQHHCRACGEVFCNSCSSKKSIIPKIGMEREVRVCDPCFDEINPNAAVNNDQATGSSKEEDGELPSEYLNSALAKESQTKAKVDSKEAEQQEEDELQLALALSLSQDEAEKSQKKNWSSPSQKVKSSASVPNSSSSLYKSLTAAPSSASALSNNASNYTSPYSSSISSISNAKEPVSELDKYLDRSYWEKKYQETSRVPSAPAATEQPALQTVSNGDIYSNVHQYQDEEQEEDEAEDEQKFQSDAFVNTMEKSIDMFVQQMTKMQNKGKHIALDTSVQSLFHSLSAMHPQLLQLIEDEDESKAKYDAMLQKLSVIREARETLNDMRAQHQEKMRQQELEQEMLRRMQMEQKLELMRQQKQEYLEYQHQLQLQRQMELDSYQREKMIYKQGVGAFKGGPVPIAGYGANQMLPQQPPMSIGYIGAPVDAVEANMATMPPPYSSLTKSSIGPVPSQQLPPQQLGKFEVVSSNPGVPQPQQPQNWYNPPQATTHQPHPQQQQTISNMPPPPQSVAANSSPYSSMVSSSSNQYVQDTNHMHQVPPPQQQQQNLHQIPVQQQQQPPPQQQYQQQHPPSQQQHHQPQIQQQSAYQQQPAPQPPHQLQNKFPPPQQQQQPLPPQQPQYAGNPQQQPQQQQQYHVQQGNQQQQQQPLQQQQPPQQQQQPPQPQYVSNQQQQTQYQAPQFQQQQQPFQEQLSGNMKDLQLISFD